MNYVAPELQIIGSVHSLTLAAKPVPIIPGKPKVIGGTYDGVKLKMGGKIFEEGYS